ncbi:MAG: ATP-binding protein [Planctomycetota bacterium]|nr:ATP-binding protein [Planctomycetota bacterium]
MRRVGGLAVRITAPFAAIFALAFVAAGALIASAVVRDAEERAHYEMRFALSVAANPRVGFALTDQLLKGIRHYAVPAMSVGGMEFLALRPDGTVAAATFGDPSGDPVAAAVAERYRSGGFPELRKEAAADRPAGLSGETAAVRLFIGGETYHVLYTSRVDPAPRRTDLFLIYSDSGVRAARWRALRPFLWIGIPGVLMAMAAGAWIGGRIARPIRMLAGTARRIATGSLEERVPVAGGDEIGELAAAFNEMQDGLRRARESLVRSERLTALGMLAAAVAHEIRNPLTSIRMTVEMLDENRLGPDGAEAKRMLLDELDRLNIQLDSLLTFARRPKPVPAPANVNALVSDTLRLLARQLEHARVSVERRLSPDMPEIPLDAGQIRQVLLNLFLNAVQAMPRGGTLTVRTSVEEDRIAIEVEDTGMGIPETDREKVFSPFFTTKEAGGGLGLALARRIVEDHGGTITFDSRPGRTVFRVSLSARPAPADAGP